MNLSFVPVILLLSCGGAFANTAVSDTNGKMGLMLGDLNSDSIMSLEGSIAWPIRDQYGFQLDALYSSHTDKSFGFNQSDDEHTGGLGAHYFWRDSETALIGLQGGYITSEPADTWEFGIEAERYIGALTLGGKAGLASIDVDSTVPPFAQDDENYYFQFYLGFYPVDDFWIAPTIEHRFDNTLYGLEIEYELPARGWSVFANAMFGEHNYQQTFIGMRYYFDDDKPLKLRHRESDPKIQLHSMRSGIATHQAAAAARYAAEIKRLRAILEQYYSGGTLNFSSGTGNYTALGSGGSLTVNNFTFSGNLGGTLSVNPLANSVMTRNLSDPSILDVTFSNGNAATATMTPDNRARINMGNQHFITTNPLPILPLGGSYIFQNGMYVVSP